MFQVSNKTVFFFDLYLLHFFLFVNLASSLLNWSYQNTKACTVLVGENSDGFPVSKTTTSEDNLSTSSRPRPSSSGGNARKRRRAQEVASYITRAATILLQPLENAIIIRSELKKPSLWLSTTLCAMNIIQV